MGRSFPGLGARRLNEAEGEMKGRDEEPANSSSCQSTVRPAGSKVKY
jgi:hypothetical protein